MREKFAGGLRLPGDETGDCFKFTSALAAVCRAARRRVPLRRDDPAHRDERRPDHRRRDEHGRSPPTPMWWRSAAIRRCCCGRIGIRVPVYPVKGYSLTVPITDPSGAPESTVMDETHKVAITRLGDRIRVGGTAELDGYNTGPAPGAARARSNMSSSDLYPGGGDVAPASSGAACGR